MSGCFLPLVVEDTAGTLAHQGRVGVDECVTTSMSSGQFILHPVGRSRKEIGNNGSALWGLLSFLT